MKLYLVRHGQTDWNVARKFQGDTDIPLNEKGIKQSYIVKEKLNNINIDLCISSPLSRALETAKIICDNTQGDRAIVGADTIVVNNNEIYGKPKDRQDALRMLRDLQGKSHKVYTSIAVLIEKNGEYKEAMHEAIKYEHEQYKKAVVSAKWAPLVYNGNVVCAKAFAFESAEKILDKEIVRVYDGDKNFIALYQYDTRKDEYSIIKMFYSKSDM